MEELCLISFSFTSAMHGIFHIVKCDCLNTKIFHDCVFAADSIFSVF